MSFIERRTVNGLFERSEARAYDLRPKASDIIILL